MTDAFLMLDCDLQRIDKVKKFAKTYAKEYDLGSSVVFKTSDTPQIDLFGHRLTNCCIIFGMKLSWDEIRWHVQEVYSRGMVNRGFLAMRYFGSITIRVNAKNKKIPHPTLIAYFDNGDDTGVFEFIDFWRTCRKEG